MSSPLQFSTKQRQSALTVPDELQFRVSTEKGAGPECQWPLASFERAGVEDARQDVRGCA